MPGAGFGAVEQAPSRTASKNSGHAVRAGRWIAEGNGNNGAPRSDFFESRECSIRAMACGDFPGKMATRPRNATLQPHETTQFLLDKAARTGSGLIRPHGRLTHKGIHCRKRSAQTLFTPADAQKPESHSASFAISLTKAGNASATTGLKPGFGHE